MELGKFTKTPYLVLFIVLISIGVGTASALITITLSGDVIITGFLDMTGDKIANVDTPTLPTDAATKAYVDSAPGTDTLASLGCADGEIAKFVGNGWACGVDTDTLALLGCTTDQIARFVSPKMFVVGSSGDSVYEYTLGTGFDVSTASFVDSFSVAAQETSPTGVAFSSDGTKMFVVGNEEGDIDEYTLSTAFDVSTASFVDSFSVAGQEIDPQGVAFSSDGTKMFVVGNVGDDVNEYTLSTPFDVSTASFVDSFSVAAQATAPRGLAFSPNGTKMFVAGIDADNVNEYTLSTPFDVSTASFVHSFSVAAQETIPQGVTFSSDGTKMFVLGFAGGDVNEYTLSTPFDVSTASFVDSFSVAIQETSPRGLAFSSGEGWVCSNDS